MFYHKTTSLWRPVAILLTVPTFSLIPRSKLIFLYLIASQTQLVETQLPTSHPGLQVPTTVNRLLLSTASIQLWSTPTSLTMQMRQRWISSRFQVKMIWTNMCSREIMRTIRFVLPTVLIILTFNFNNSNSTSTFRSPRFLRLRLIRLIIKLPSLQLHLQEDSCHQK